MVEEDTKVVDYSKPFCNDTPGSMIVGEED